MRNAVSPLSGAAIAGPLASISSSIAIDPRHALCLLLEFIERSPGPSSVPLQRRRIFAPLDAESLSMRDNAHDSFPRICLAPCVPLHTCDECMREREVCDAKCTTPIQKSAQHLSTLPQLRSPLRS